MASKVPSIPSVPTGDAQTYQFLSALKESVELLTGQRTGTSIVSNYTNTTSGTGSGTGGSGGTGTVVNGGFDGTTGIETVASLPTTQLYIGRLVYLESDGKLYRYNGTGWTKAVASNDLTGQIVAAQVADGAISTAKFATSIKPIEIVSTLPAAGTQGRIVFLTSDNKMYRDTGTEWVATIAAGDISGTLTNAQIADLAAVKITGQLVASQIADATLTTAKFASGIEPISVVSALPGSKTTSTVFLTTNGKLYRWDGSAYVASVSTSDLSGTITNAQIAGVEASKVTGQLTDSQLAAIGAAKVTGQFVASQIADAAVTTAKFASGIEPITVVSSVPGTKSTNSIFNTADGKLYRWDGSAYAATVATTDLTGTITNAQIAAVAASKVTGQLTNTQIADVAAAKLTGQITETQITDNAISTAKLAAGAVTAATIAADTITSAQIAANAITSAELAAGAVVAGKIAAGSIQAADIAAGTITGDRLAANTITASQIASDTITAGQIAAGAISASELAAGSVTTSKLFVSGQGSAISDDPNCRDQSAWTGWSGNSVATVTAITDGKVGNSVLRATGSTRSINARFIPCDPGKTYRLSAWVRAVGCNGTLYLRTVDYLPNEASVSGGLERTYAGLEAVTVPNNTWTRYWTQFTVPAGRAFVTPHILLAWGATAGYMEAQDVRIDEVIPGELIVDGAITAAKVAANTITAAQIAADTITSAQIAANAITSAELAAGAVIAGKIAAGSIQAADIAAGTITGDRLAANTITASQIAADTITAGQIAAGAISASELAAGAVTTSKLLVTGRGAALNDDPFTSDATAWPYNGLWTPSWSIQTVTDGVAGNTVIRTNTGVGQVYAGSRPIAFNPNKAYRVRGKLRSVGGSYTAYLVVDLRDSSGSVIGGDGTAWYYPLSGSAVPTSWTDYEGRFGYGTSRPFPANARTMSVGALMNYGSGAGYQEVQDLRIEEMVDGSLVVDGAITAAKIAANTITAGQIASGTITASQIASDTITAGQIAAGAIGASEIAAGAVNASKIAAGTITSNEIAANTITAGNILAGTITATELAGNTITGDKIVGGTITGAKIATGTLTAGLIDSRGLSIKDSAGNIIFYAGNSPGISPYKQGGGNNVLDSSWWQTGATPALWAPLNASSSNFPLRNGPDGALRTVWYGPGYGTTQAGTGWTGTNFPVDETKIYRYAMWTKASGTTDGSFYMGLGTCIQVSDGVENSNPYFISAPRNNLVTDRWYLVVGYVQMSSYSGAALGQGGVFDGSTGQKILTAADFKWKSGTTANLHRAFSYYASSTSYQEFWGARVDLCDGSEPTLQELLAITAISASLSNAPAGILNSNVTATSIGAVKTDASNAPASILNSNITLSAGAISGIGTGSGTVIDNSYATIGQNLIPNSDQTSAFTWSGITYNPGGATFDSLPQYASTTWDTTTYVLQGSTTRNIWFHQSGIIAGGDSAVAGDIIMNDGAGAALKIPVIPGERYVASAYIANHRCAGQVYIGFFDSSDAIISYSVSASVGPTNNYANQLATPYYNRAYTAATAPAGASTVRFWVRKLNTITGNSDSYIWVAAPQFERVNANVSTPSPYQPGPVGSTRQLGYSGDLAATKNIITYATTAPASPTDGDVWVDTSSSPVVVKVRVAGAWQVGGNYTTNTNQLTDGAGLGTTATWGNVTGTGKPADGATKNTVYRQATAPTGASVSDLWFNTSTFATYYFDGSSWVLAGDRTSSNTAAAITGQGALATLSAVGTSQINDGAVTAVKVASLSVGTISSAVNSGATVTGRVVIDATAGGRIMIYDSSNVLRMKIGYLG